MKIKITYLLIGIFLFSSLILVSAQSNEEIICDYSEQFLREHIISDGFNYSQNEVINLTNLINVYLIPNILVDDMSNFLNNFETKCNRTNPVYFKIIKEESNYTLITIQEDNLSCSQDIGKKAEISLGFISLAYDMDWYIPFFKIDMNTISCDSLNFWKWIFKYQDNGKGFYSFIGFKIWWILSFGLIIFVLKFFKRKNHENRKLNSLIDKKLEE